MKLRCVIFDLDGTIVDVPYDWDKIRVELETQGIPILHFLNSLEEPERSEKWQILERYEDEATRKAELKQGMHELLDLLTKKGIKKAVVTNNSQKNAFYLLEKFNLNFDYIITRESGLWKPSGAPFLEVMKKLGLKKEECSVVGDSPFDVRAANEVGISRVFILSENRERFASTDVELFNSVEALRQELEKLLKKTE
ncbi:MAG: HAD family phosphatase [Candidatus Aminicenantes bacterium]|nr:MAG: HAD family phosphatase [Candidatus Aminicenantes bacterium]